MKKLLIASTALSLAGGAAFAEISISGDAELGVDYNSEAGEGMSKHSFVHEVGIDFSASGTTDGGLTFGGSAGFDTNDDMVNLGTVHVSGSFGTLTIGDNDPGSFIAGGIADIGMNGIGVDDMAENLRKGTASQLRYDNSFGQVSIAISAGTKAGSAAVAGKAADEWTIRGYGADNRLATFTTDPTKYTSTTDATAPDVASLLDRDIGVFRVMNTEGKPTGVVNSVTNTGTEGNDPLTNVMLKEGGDISKDADIVVHTVAEDDTITTPAASATQVALFREYVKAYHLGDDMRVGGTEENADTLLDNDGNMKITNNVVATVPAVSAETEFAFGMNFETGGVTIGLGYDSNKTISMGAGFSAGEISTNLLYVKMDDDEDKDGNQEATSMGVDLSYSMGASKVTLAYGRHKPEMDGMEAMDAVGMGVTHDLGGGATMNAGFGKVDTMVDKKIVSQNKASIGLMFAF